MDWSEDSAKALVVIGDAPPHPPSYTDQNIDWWNETELLKGMGVKVRHQPGNAKQCLVLGCDAIERYVRSLVYSR